MENVGWGIEDGVMFSKFVSGLEKPGGLYFLWNAAFFVLRLTRYKDHESPTSFVVRCTAVYCLVDHSRGQLLKARCGTRAMLELHNRIHKCL